MAACLLQLMLCRPGHADLRHVGKIVSLLPQFNELVAANAKLEVIADGYDWCEGPVWVRSGEFLLYSDIPPNTIFRWDAARGAQVYLQPSGYTGDAPRRGEQGSNGLLLDASGRLILCQHGDRRVARMDAPLTAPAPKFVTLADRYDGRRLNSPNDAAWHSNGDLYFTDPPYGLERNMDDPAKELPYQGVYRLGTDGRVQLLTAEMSRPNGIAFSPDERTLYVANSDPENAVWMAFAVNSDGTLAPGRIFFDAAQLVGKQPGLPDGMCVDQRGNLWATGPGGVIVLSPAGRHLGTLETTQATSNCTFGENGSTLFMTADRYVLRVQLNVKGLGF